MLSNVGLSKFGSPLIYEWLNPNLDYCEGWPTFMDFRLIYDGPLKAAAKNNPRVQEKHAVRKQLHSQLAMLWEKHDQLKRMKTWVEPESHTIAQMRAEFGWFADPDTTIFETFARRFTRSNGFRFVPLVNKEYQLVCGLDILFLRRENPGDLILQGGDIDNRLKTLLDGLRVPTDGGEFPLNARPEPHEEPFCCLLENDSLITELKVTTDRLLRPLREGENETNVVLLMHVVVKTTRLSSHNMHLM